MYKFKIKNSELNYIKELYSSQRKMTHDYKNKLTTVKALINEGNTDKAREYTDTLLDSVIYHSKIISTNNDIVDALLNSKYYLCHSRNIVIQFKVDKELTGRHLNDGEFEFVLKQTGGDKIKSFESGEKTVTNNAAGAVDFGNIKFDQTEVGDYEFEITEKSGDIKGVTYSKNIYTAKVNLPSELSFVTST